MEIMRNAEQLRTIADHNMGEGGVFVYGLTEMAQTAQTLQAAEMPYGLTVRYAAKANPDPIIVRCFEREGLSFDASSASEAVHLLNQAGILGDKISLSSQILRDSSDLEHALDLGVRQTATSIRQIGMLARVGANFGLENIAVRPNPGKGYGGNKRTTVGGPAASFGIWKEQMPEALAEAASNGLTIDRIHTHIGSGVKPQVWRETMQNSLAIVEQCPDVTTLDIGGGYKIARMPDEEATDMDKVFDVFADEIERFADRTGREIHLEIEPGTLLVGNAAVLLARVEEVVSTGSEGYEFIKLNAGMNAILRPSLYGAQHPIEVLNDSDEYCEYVVVGPCCESGDILTPVRDKPEEIATRTLKKAQVGDYVAIGGAGAYCASMNAAQYNHIPKPTNVFLGYELDQQG